MSSAIDNLHTWFRWRTHSPRAEPSPQSTWPGPELELFALSLCKSKYFYWLRNIFASQPNIFCDRIRKSLRLVVCDGTGCLGLYSLDQEEGGDCSLIRQFLLASDSSVSQIIFAALEIFLPPNEIFSAVPGEQLRPRGAGHVPWRRPGLGQRVRGRVRVLAPATRWARVWECWTVRKMGALN